MTSSYLLSKKDYTLYNALAWGNCSGHYLRARAATTSLSERIFHGAAALVELLPIISQVVSLSEMAFVSWFRPSTDTRRQVRHIEFQEPVLPHQNRTMVPLTPAFDLVDVALPTKIENLDEALFPLHRKIESQYSTLPWPAKMQKIIVLTQVTGGRGDIAAAAKTIALMQKLCPTLSFDWVLQGAEPGQYDPMAFLNCNDPSKVGIRYWLSNPPEEAPGDFLLTGPVKLCWGVDYIESRILRKIAGPTFGFMENAERLPTFYREILQLKVKNASQQATPSEIYQTLHFTAFPSKSDNSIGLLPMGVQPGSGVFLDQSRLKAPLSRGYCCPSYLLHIQDVELRKDILEAMNVFDGQSEPDYDQYSFNSGYAHHPASWGKFIDCVAIHEKNKHVVIVLNHKGEFAPLSTQQFQDQIFTPQRLAFLKQKGYGTVQLKEEEQDAIFLHNVGDPQSDRDLTVIIRASFIPNDMKQMQLASERLLGTGDNSAVESWCARCKLYLYEDVANGGCKWRFLQQQVDLAETISPNLSKLLALFGGDKRLSDPSLNKPLSPQKMAEIEQILDDPNLSDATLQFCDRITTNYSFHEVLEAALKRTVWHHYIPELAKIEAETLDEDFGSGLVAYLKNPEAQGKALRVRAIPELGKRVQEAVHRYLSS
jgi:hypothetical protein